jgi:hypothetical protein
MSDPRTTEESAVDRVVIAAREFVHAWRLPSTPAADQIDALESALAALDREQSAPRPYTELCGRAHHRGVKCATPTCYWNLP